MYRALGEVVAIQSVSSGIAPCQPRDPTRTSLRARATRRPGSRRGAVTVAGAAMERAAALTADSPKRSAPVSPRRRCLDSVSSKVSRLVDQTVSSNSGPRPGAACLFRQILSGSVWFESGAARTFVSIAEQLSDGGDATWPCARWCRSHIDPGGRARDADPGISRRGRDGHGRGDDDPACW